MARNIQYQCPLAANYMEDAGSGFKKGMQTIQERQCYMPALSLL